MPLEFLKLLETMWPQIVSFSKRQCRLHFSSASKFVVTDCFAHVCTFCSSNPFRTFQRQALRPRPPCRARSPRLPASGLAWLPASSLAPLPASLATALGRQKAMGDGCAARSSMGPKPKARADPLQQSSQSALQPSSRAHLLDCRERPPPRPWGTSGWQSPRGDPRMWRRSHMSWRQTCGQRRLLLRHRRQCRR